MPVDANNKLLKVVNDQLSAPTYSRDLAGMIISLCLNKKFMNSLQSVEILHYCNDGYATRYDFAKQIIQIKQINCKIDPINSAYYNSKVKRPKYSLLNNNKIIKEIPITTRYADERSQLHVIYAIRFLISTLLFCLKRK